MRRGYPQWEWYYDVRRQLYCYVKIPDEDAVFADAIEPEATLTRYAYDDLKNWMAENDPHGVIRTDRKEDLKIIHRLLDVIEKREIS